MQLCTVLEYLHCCQPPIVFRDLKPGNVLHTSRGNVYLIDFGIARRYQPGKLRDTQRLGSPGYAAPEQYGRAQTTPQAGLSSLGAVLHFLLSGQDPADSPVGLLPLRLHGHQDLSALLALLTSLLSPHPIGRPASAHVVAARLEQIRQQVGSAEARRIRVPPAEPPSPPADGPHQQPSRSRAADGVLLPPVSSVPGRGRLNRRRVLLTLGGLALPTGTGIGITWAFTQSPAALYQGPSFRIAWFPDGTRLASASDDHTVQIWEATTERA